MQPNERAAITTCRYAAGALERVVELNRAVWQDNDLGQRAAKLLRDIEAGGQACAVRCALWGARGAMP